MEFMHAQQAAMLGRVQKTNEKPKPQNLPDSRSQEALAGKPLNENFPRPVDPHLNRFG